MSYARTLLPPLLAAALAGLPSSADAAPLFDDALANLGDQPCGGGGCWTNYLRVADLDGDDALDVVFVNYAGFFNMGQPQPLAVFTNAGDGTFTDDSMASVGGYSERVRQVGIGDVDGDGNVDIVAPNGWAGPNALFMGNGDGTFTDEGDSRLPSGEMEGVVYAGGVRLGDLDDDGDLDIFIADGYGQGQGFSGIGRLWLNDGAGQFSDASARLPTDKEGYDPDDVDFIDIDRDFDLDILINMHTSNVSLWINDGDAGFTDAPDQIADQPQGTPQQGGAYHYNPAVCDVDGDGDLDIWIDNTGPGYGEQLLINDGSSNFVDETDARVTGNPSADDNGVVCADVDDDGDFDAIVISLSGNERVLENDGAGNFTALGDAFPVVDDPSLWGEFGDLNGDGRVDFVSGQGEGQPELNRVYLGNENTPADSLPPVFPALEDIRYKVGDGASVVVHFAVSDRSVTDGGPRLSGPATVEFDFDGRAQTPVAAQFMGGDLFRAVLPGAPEGTSVSYRACATDQAGNTACSRDQGYDVGAGGETTDGTDTGTGSDTDPTSGPTSGATTGDTSGPTSDSAGSASETDTSAGPSTEGETDPGGDGNGCGCRHREDGGLPAAPLWLLAAGWFAVRRPRRPAARRG